MNDPLLVGAPLPIEATCYPLGFRLRIRTNSEAAVRVAVENWSDAQAFDGYSAELRILVSDQPGGEPVEPSYHGQPGLMTVVSGPASHAVCDFDRGIAACWLAPETVARSAWVRHFFLDPIVYSMLCYDRLTPVHASCVARDGAGLVLCGTSGAGKSCLAFACARDGWTLVADDSVFLLRGSVDDRVVLGQPRRFHFRESAAELFAELKGLPATLRVNGKASIEVAVSGIGVETATRCRVRRIILLDRRESGAASLEPVPAPEAFALLERDLVLYDARVVEEQRQSLWRLLETPAMRLTYSSLDDALQVLRAGA